ncbi:MAG: Crp/Fnr family transcriptional regulator [Candidatus Eisenbacteria bacterium]
MATSDKTTGKEVVCAFCDLRKIGLFGALEEDFLSRVDEEKTVHSYRARQVIFHEGTPPLAIYCVRAGRVKLYRSGSKGEEVVLRILGPGDVFGHRPLLAGELYAATAEAIEEAEVCVLPKQTLTELLRVSPSLAFEMLARLSRDLRISEDQLIDLSQRSVKQRAASLLLTFLEGSGESVDGGIKLSIPIQRKEMAQMVGTTPETFSRTLHDLAERGLVSLSRSEIIVVDEAALRRVSGD